MCGLGWDGWGLGSVEVLLGVGIFMRWLYYSSWGLFEKCCRCGVLVCVVCFLGLYVLISRVCIVHFMSE